MTEVSIVHFTTRYYLHYLFYQVELWSGQSYSSFTFKL